MDIKKERLVSLDVFRGITVAGMILVNNPGSWGAIYPALGHAAWHGVTPTDLIFPFFLFIVGVAITLSLYKRLQKGDSKKSLIVHIVQRGVTIFLLGMLLTGFPFFGVGGMVREGASYWYVALLLLLSFCYNGAIVALIYFLFPVFDKCFCRAEKGSSKDKRNFYIMVASLVILIILFFVLFPYNGLNRIRIPGVLQRIAVVYTIASILFLYFDHRKIIYWIIGLTIVYLGFMFLYPVPNFGAADFSKEGNFAGYLDNLLLAGHMWASSKTWDPEGIFSTLPAITTALFGILTGYLLRSEKNIFEKTTIMFVAGSLLALLGVILDMWIPINKSLWTPSYAFYCAGMALFFLAVCMYLIDVKEYKKVFQPFLAFGMNAITVFFFSGLMARLMGIFRVDLDGNLVGLQRYIYMKLCVPYFSDLNASLTYALLFVFFWYIIMAILYHKKIFIKI
jgi:predicted acyltransferase